MFLFVAMLIASVSFVSCDKDDNKDKVNPNNQFAGTWTKDGSNGAVTVILTETAWTAKYNNSTYNSGTYTYEGNVAEWKITNKGMGDANVGETGSATISNGKMIVSSFSDTAMNGSYTKK